MFLPDLRLQIFSSKGNPICPDQVLEYLRPCQLANHFARDTRDKIVQLSVETRAK